MNWISHIRWDDLIINWTVKANWVVVNLTWASIKWGVSKKKERDIIISWTWTITNAVLWTYKVHITNLQTSGLEVWTYYLDIQLTDSLWVVQTIWQYQLNLTYDVIQ